MDYMHPYSPLTSPIRCTATILLVTSGMARHNDVFKKLGPCPGYIVVPSIYRWLQAEHTYDTLFVHIRVRTIPTEPPDHSSPCSRVGLKNPPGAQFLDF